MAGNLLDSKIYANVTVACVLLCHFYDTRKQKQSLRARERRANVVGIR